MTEPKISVVTACFNANRTIERTVRSVVKQTYANKEYIIVDGGSTDGTLETVDRYRDGIDRIVSEPDNGIYDAMNKGISLARGEWIHLLNADDYYTNDEAIAKAVPCLDPLRTNYFSMFREQNGVLIDEYRVAYRKWMMYVSAKLPHPAMIVHRDQYSDVGVYDSTLRIAADHDFIMRMVRRYPPKFLDFPLVSMEQGGLSEQRRDLSFREFMDVTVRYGCPRSVAIGIYWTKHVWCRIRAFSHQAAAPFSQS